MNKKLLYTSLFLLFMLAVSAQTKVRIYGYIIDPNNRGVESANVYIEGTKVGTSTNQNGYYELNVVLKDSATLIYSRIGYRTIRHTIHSSQKVLQGFT